MNDNDRLKMIVTEVMISQLVQKIHEASGYPGWYKTHAALVEACTFKHMSRAIAKVIKEYDSFQRNKPMNVANKGPTISHKLKFKTLRLK